MTATDVAPTNASAGDAAGKDVPATGGARARAAIAAARHVAADAAIILAIVLAGLVAVRELFWRDSLLVGHVEVSPTLQQQGITSGIAARMLVDRLAEMARPAPLSGERRALAALTASAALPQIDIPATGLSLSTLVDVLRPIVGRPRKEISAELTMRDSQIVMVARYQSEAPLSLTVGRHRLDSAMTLAASYVMHHAHPALLASYFEARGDTVAAWREVRRALLRGGRTDSADAYVVRGNLLLARDSSDAAIASFDTAARLDPFVLPLLRAARVFVARRDFAAADRYVSRALQRSPRDPAAVLGYAELLEQRGAGSKEQAPLKSDTARADDLYAQAAALLDDPAPAYAAHVMALAARGQFDRARQVHELALAETRQKNTRFQLRLNWGQALADRDRNVEAVHEFEEAAKIDSTQWTVFLNWCDALRGAERYDDALRICARGRTVARQSGATPLLAASQVDPTERHIYTFVSPMRLVLVEGFIELERGREAAAVARLNEIAGKDEHDALLAYGRTVAMLSLRRPAEAKAAVGPLLHRHPRLASAHQLMGRTLLQSRDPRGALHHFDQARQLGGRSSSLPLERADALLQLGDTVVAIREIAVDSAGTAPLSSWVYLANERVRRGERLNALLVLLDALRRPRAPVGLIEQLTRFAQTEGSKLTREDTDTLRRVADSDPSGRTALALAVVESARGDERSALSWFERASRSWGSDRAMAAIGLGQWGHSLLAVGRIGAAENRFKEALTLDLTSGPALKGRIQIAMDHTRDFAGAERLIRDGLARNVLDSTFHGVLGIALIGQGKNAQSVEWFERAVRAMPRDAVVRYSYGQALEIMQRYADAYTNYKLARQYTTRVDLRKVAADAIARLEREHRVGLPVSP